jgi:hypothetical protein
MYAVGERLSKLGRGTVPSIPAQEEESRIEKVLLDPALARISWVWLRSILSLPAEL